MLNGRLYVAGQRSHNVGVIENGRLSRVIPVGTEPTALVADEAAGKLFVLHSRGLLLSMLDGERVQATIPLSNSLKGDFQSALRMVGDPLNHRLYVVLDTARPDPEIVVVDTQAFTVSVRVPFNQHLFNNQIALDTSNHLLLTADANLDHSFGYIDTLDLQNLRWTNAITMPGNGWSNFLLYDPQSKRAYTDYTETGYDYHLAAIADGKVVSSLLLDRNPLAAQVSAGRLYLTNEYSSTLMVNLQTCKHAPRRRAARPPVYRDSRNVLSRGEPHRGGRPDEHGGRECHSIERTAPPTHRRRHAQSPLCADALGAHSRHQRWAAGARTGAFGTRTISDGPGRSGRQTVRHRIQRQRRERHRYGNEQAGRAEIH